MTRNEWRDWIGLSEEYMQDLENSIKENDYKILAVIKEGKCLIELGHASTCLPAKVN